jgi:SAM-dependent methyltransferase
LSGDVTLAGVPAGAFDPYAENSSVARFVQGLVESSEETLTAIHKADDMYRYNVGILKGSGPCAAVLYYAKGWQIFQTIQRLGASRFGEFRKTPRLLDFASGHGRVTRFLARELDPSRISVAEILEDAVSFQRDYFGVEGLLSSPEPEQFECKSSFPLIVVSSFFSHIAPAAFSGWLAALLGCLEPDGLLLFSTLSGELSSDPAGAGEAGSLFVPQSETNRLDKNAYGTTYVTEDFVRAAVSGARRRQWTVRRFRRALCSLQDLYLVAPADAEVTAFEPISLPWGSVDPYFLSPGPASLEIAGWLERIPEGSEPDRVELRVDNRTVAAVRPQQDGQCNYRWSLEVDSRVIGADDVVMVVARTANGFENLVGLGTMRTHPPGIR